MIVSKSTGAQFLSLLTSIFTAGVAVTVAAVYLFPLTIDEAYVTYHHARNFARSGRLVYHLTNPHFSVSSPLYAALLVFVYLLRVVPRRKLSFMATATSLAKAAVALLFTRKASDHFLRGEYLEAAVAGLAAGVSTLIFIAVVSGKSKGAAGDATAGLSQPAVARPSTLCKEFWTFSAVLIPVFLYLTLSSGGFLTDSSKTWMIYAPF